MITPVTTGALGILRVVRRGPVAVIGDIHGRVDHLDALLRKLPADIGIVVTGDVCDRGPDTREVIERLIQRGAVGARGNHDEWLVEWASGRGFDRAALPMGGEATLTSYGSVGRDVSEVTAESNLVPRSHLAWLDSLALAVDLHVDGHAYWVIHAGVPEGIDARVPSVELVGMLIRERPVDLLWAFNDPSLMPRLDRSVIFGHRCHDKALDLGHAIAIDTGCGTKPRGYLTALLLPERRFVDSR